MVQQGWCALDVETTGLHPERGDRVIEVGIWSKTYGVWQTLVNPGVLIPKSVTQVHGIDGHLLVGAPQFSDILEEFASLLEGQVIVGHNVCFDLRCLHFEFARAGKRLPAVSYVDSIELGEQAGLGRQRLSRLAALLGVEARGESHRAGCDAALVGECVEHLLAQLGHRHIQDIGCTPFRYTGLPLRGLA